jgi:hypothetical protein
MKPVNIYGPVAWFGVDEGMYHIERGDAVRFVSETELPVQLLVEHDPSLVIGQVTKLKVDKDKLVAHCVVDDSLFISLLNNLQQCGEKYKSLEIGTFLNILLPSFSSYHMNGSYAIREISIVDVGRREGSLWKVDPQLKDGLQSTTRRITISLERVNSKLLYMLLGQRQQDNRHARLCRAAKVCGLSTEFVSASSLSPSPKIEQSRKMTTPNYSEMAHAFTALFKALGGDDPVNLPSSAMAKASEEAIYSSNDVKQMMLKLEKKHLDRTELEQAMEEVVKRQVSKKMMDNKRNKADTGRRGTDVLEKSASEDEENDNDEQQADDSYTSVSVGKRICKMMKRPGKSSAKKAKLISTKQANEETSDSDTDTIEGKEGEEEDTKTQAKVMNDRINQMFAMLTSLISSKESHKQAAQQSTPETNPQENRSQPHPRSPDNTQTLAITSTDEARANSKEGGLYKGKAGSDVKSSGLDDEVPKDIVADLFQ